jgi:hypothetical protein
MPLWVLSKRKIEENRVCYLVVVTVSLFRDRDCLGWALRFACSAENAGIIVDYNRFAILHLEDRNWANTYADAVSVAFVWIHHNFDHSWGTSVLIDLSVRPMDE